MGGLTDGTNIGTGEKIVIFLNIMRGNTHRDGLSLWCLNPFRGVRYHLKEWNNAIAANILPQNSRELFNMRHSKPRNVVKSIYG